MLQIRLIHFCGKCLFHLVWLSQLSNRPVESYFAGSEGGQLTSFSNSCTCVNMHPRDYHLLLHDDPKMDGWMDGGGGGDGQEPLPG